MRSSQGHEGPIKAVIYDLDDLMVNSYSLHVKAFGALLKEHGYKLSDLPDKKFRDSLGMRVIDILANVIKELNLDISLKDFSKERSRIFLKLVRERLKAMPGLMHSLRLLKRNNFRLAIASSGAMDYINIVLRKFDLAGYFDVVVSGDDVKVGKPDPETYLVACRKLHLEPRQCVVLEDATKGIESAKAAGCMCIAIRNPIEPPQDYSKADLVLRSLQELSISGINGLGRRSKK
jgi:HAD superfamily hydrolase (TIGR01509 family)